MEKQRIVIVGAGPAGLAAAKAAAGKGHEVLLCGAENLLPYWRPRLPSLLHTPLPPESLLVEKPEWYEKNGIRVELRRIMESLDRKSKKVLWTSGEQTAYDKLIMAVGSSPFVPEFEGRDRAYVLRTYEDALKIREALKKNSRVTLIGGGLLSLEMALEIKKSGAEVKVAELFDWLLPRQLDRPGGEFIKNVLEAQGLEIKTGVQIAERPDLTEGTCVIAAAGTKPNTKPLRDSRIPVNRGILVDERMRTSDEDVFACGDVAEFGGRCSGLIPPAQAQGAVAGANAAGGDVLYREPVPSPILKLSSMSITSIGDISEGEGKAFVRESDRDRYLSFVLKNGILCGAILMGDLSLATRCRAAVDKGLTLPDTSHAGEIKAYLEKTL